MSQAAGIKKELVRIFKEKPELKSTATGLKDLFQQFYEQHNILAVLKDLASGYDGFLERHTPEGGGRFVYGLRPKFQADPAELDAWLSRQQFHEGVGRPPLRLPPPAEPKAYEAPRRHQEPSSPHAQPVTGAKVDAALQLAKQLHDDLLKELIGVAETSGDPVLRLVAMRVRASESILQQLETMA